MCMYVRVCVLMPTLFTLSAFGLCFTQNRDESTSHFLFLHKFGGSNCRGMCVCNFEKLSKMSACVFMQRIALLRRAEHVLMALNGSLIDSCEKMYLRRSAAACWNVAMIISRMFVTKFIVKSFSLTNKHFLSQLTKVIHKF